MKRWSPKSATFRKRRRNTVTEASVTTISGHKHEAAPNVVDREFRPQRPDPVWTSDATYIATAEGWLYLFVIIDLYSLRVIGWAMSKSLGTTTLLQAVFEHIEVLYNRLRVHSTLDYLSPIEYEEVGARQAA